MDNNILLGELRNLSRKTNEEWLIGLEERKLKELEYHNKNRDENFISQLPPDLYDKLHGNKKFYRTVKLSSDYVENWIKKQAKGKVFLDYACGNGFNAIRAVKAGADLSIGVDISDISVANAKKMAQEQSVGDKTFFLQGDCENTGLPNNCVDVCVCSGVLHHLDLSYAFCELRRILKSGGVILAVEALDYNPLIKLYRETTPQMRTEWEKAHILSYKDVKFGKRFFDVGNIKHWHLFSIGGAYFPVLLPVFNALDKIVLRIPLLKVMSWMFTFEMYKR